MDELQKDAARYDRESAVAIGTLATALLANALFGAGLFAHAFLYNFYLGELGFDAAMMGTAVAAMTIGGFVALLPAGLSIDRFGARNTYMATATIAAIGLAWGAFAQNRGSLLMSSAVAGIGAAGLRVVMGPLLMGLTTAATRSRIFSWNVGLLIASGAIWTLATGAVPGWLEGHGYSRVAAMRVALVSGAVLTLFSGVIAWRLPRLQSAIANPPALSRALLAGLRIPQGAFVLVAIVAVWMTAAALVLPFFNVYFRDVHGLSVARIGVLFSISQGVMAAALLVSGELAARFGARRVVVAWVLLFAPVMFLMPLPLSLPAIMTLYFLQGVVAPATNPLLDQILLEDVAVEKRGAVSSWRNAATEVAGAIGATVGGYVLTAHGFPVLFNLAAVLALMGATALGLRLLRATSGTSPVTT